jgi:hypothetical protein
MAFYFIFCSSIRILHFYENDKTSSYPSTNPHYDYSIQPLLVNLIIFIGELTSKYETYIFLYPYASILSRMGANA